MRKKLTEEEKEEIKKQKEEANKISRKKYELEDLRRRPIPEPTIYWKVGDRVEMGYSKLSLIKEVIDDGKIYLLDQIVTENNYGKPFDYEREIYVSWVDVCSYRSDEELRKIPNLFEPDDYRLSFSQRDMRGLMLTHYGFGVDFNPEYQREFVWTSEDKTKLLDSIFSNIEIGKFVFIRRPFKENSPSYEILDGKQRLRTILDFYEGRFPYKGIIYRDLSNRDKGMFNRCPISYAEIDRERMKESEKYKYFLRLNCGGKIQSREHLDKIEKKYLELIKEGK